KFIIEETEYSFSNNSMFLVAPGKFHVLSEPPKSNYDRIIIYFDLELLPNNLPNDLTFHTVTSEQVKDLFLKFDNYSKTFDYDTLKILFQGFLNEVLLTARSYSNESKNLPPLIQNAIAFIDQNADTKLTLDIIADNLYISKTGLSHAFSKVMNLGVMNYVQLKKMYRARTLIKKGYTATKTAEMLGYESYPTFIRNYKKVFSINPSNEKK
ncbi:MAG: helix-turn-helix transcriptional regulator, partial [Clostridia bacterium]|nr:helix-turn-helix transcriptional regulator [Clostridia bacterium]